MQITTQKPQSPPPKQGKMIPPKDCNFSTTEPKHSEMAGMSAKNSEVSLQKAIKKILKRFKQTDK